jgi:glycerol-3-phosphate dehydrogenase
MAQDAVDVAVPDLRRIVPESCTATLPIVGADGYQVLKNKVETLAEEYKLSNETVTHLLERYGSLVEDIFELIIEDPQLRTPISGEALNIKAEIVYAATHEGARSVDDVISRRTRLSFELGDHGASIAQEVGSLIAPVLGWSASDQKKSVNLYLDQISREVAALKAAKPKAKSKAS